MKKVYYCTKEFIDYDIANFVNGFIHLGYTPERKKVINIAELNEEDVYVSSFNHIGELFGEWNEIEDYPFEIRDYLKRIPSQDSWGHILKCDSGHHFIKPVKKGLFTPFVSKLPIQNNIDMMPYLHVSERAECWIQDPLTILTEWRVFVLDGGILDIRNYAGDPFLQPSKKFVQAVVNRLDLPQPYILDVGVCKERGEFVVELNEAMGFGTYGLRPDLSAKIYLARWGQVRSKYKKAVESRRKII